MTITVGSQLPRIDHLTFVKGGPVEHIGDLTKADHGRVLVLEFWATWCPPCRDSIPHLTSLQHQYKSKGVVFVGISSETEGVVRPFVTKMDVKMDYCVAVDAQREARQKLMEPMQISGIPHAIIVDRTNTIVYSGHPMDPQFERKLEEAANQPSRPKPEPITATREELQGMSIGNLKKILSDRGVSLVGLAEKGDLIDKILETCTR